MSLVSKRSASMISFIPDNKNKWEPLGRSHCHHLTERKGGRKALGDLAKVPQLASNRVRTEPTFLTLRYPALLLLSRSHLILTITQLRMYIMTFISQMRKPRVQT